MGEYPGKPDPSVYFLQVFLHLLYFDEIPQVIPANDNIFIEPLTSCY